MMKTSKKTVGIFVVLLMTLCFICAFNKTDSYAAKKKVHLKKKKITICINTWGKTQHLIDKKGNEIPGWKVKWKSKKKSIAKIDYLGTIKGKKLGSTKMTAKYKGKTYKFTVKVRKPKLPAPKLEAPNYVIMDWGNEIQVHCNRIDEARKYLFYYSVNGSAYKLYKKTSDPYCFFNRNQNFGTLSGTYSFKVRCINGKYKSPFSKARSVTVKSDTPSTDETPKTTVQLLHDYVDSYGYVNGDGNKTFKYEVNSTTDVYFVNGKYSVELIMLQQSDTVSSIVRMILDTSYNGIVTAKVILGSGEWQSTFIPENYTKDTKLSFHSDGASDYETQINQNLVNSTFKLAMNAWNLALYTNFSIKMNDLGFTSF